MQQAAAMSKYATYKSELIPPIHGCMNAGNTCWQNACTQLLFSLSAFNEFILRRGGDPDIKSTYVKLYKKYLEQQLPLAVVNKIRAEEKQKPYIAEINNIDVENISVMLLREFIAGTTRSDYAIGQQDSPATGIIDLLESIRCEEVYKYFNNKYAVTTYCTICNKPSSRIDDRSPFVKMYVDMPIKSQSAMENWMRLRLENISDFKCESCGAKNITAERRETLNMLREIILINYRQPSLTRFFPDRMIFPERGGRTLNYKKIGQIEWSGSLDAPSADSSALESRRKYSFMSSGHYWATVSRVDAEGKEKWYTANDGSITPIAEASRNNTVIVAYHLMSVTEMTAEERKYFGIV